MADIADKFQSPVGIPATLLNGMWEPMGNAYQEQHWRSVNNFTHFYYLGPGNTNPAYHTGDDLNLNLPNNWDADAHSPVWATANGTVIYSHKVFLSSGQESTWGNLIVIEHTLPDGSLVYSRYGHLEKPLVSTGDTVKRGQQIANVGNADGLEPYHLHYDMCVTSLLKLNPPQWPALNLTQLTANYTDPYKFVKARLADMPPVPIRPTAQRRVTTSPGVTLNVRNGQNASAPVINSLQSGSVHVIYTDNMVNGYAELVEGGYASTTWLAEVTTAPVSDTIIDLSSDNVITDEAAFTAWIVANGITILHRATWGDGSDNWIDAAFLARQAKYGPLCTFIPYHVVNGDDPEKQSANALNVAKPNGVGVMMDVEVEGGTPAQALLFEAEITKRFTGKVINYTRANIWGDAPAGNGPLMIANQNTPPVLPSQYKTWAIQQHAQTSIPGVAGLVDRDQFNGTHDQLITFLKTLAGTAPAAPVVTTMYTTDDGLNVRSGPGTTYAVLRTIAKAGTVLQVEAGSIAGSGRQWRKLAYEVAYVAETYITSVKPPITPPAPQPTPTQGSVITRPGMNIQATITDHKLLQQFTDMAHRLHDANRPLGCVVWIDEPDYANTMALYTTVILRNFAAGDQFSLDQCQTPEAARAHAQFIYGLHRPWIMAHSNIQYHQLYNEKGSSPDFDLEAMRLAELDGKHLAIFGDSVGTPTPDVWKSRIPALRHAMANGHIVVKNQYGAFLNGQPANVPVSDPATRQWYGMAHEALYASAPADCRPLLVIGETQTSDDIYRGSAPLIEDMAKYLTLLRADGYVIGFCPFVFGRSTQNAAWELNDALPAWEAFVVSV